MDIKKIVFTIEQFAHIVNLLNKVQVTGIEQAKILVMIDMALNEGEQISEELAAAEGEGSGSRKEGQK